MAHLHLADGRPGDAADPRAEKLAGEFDLAVRGRWGDGANAAELTAVVVEPRPGDSAALPDVDDLMAAADLLLDRPGCGVVVLLDERGAAPVAAVGFATLFGHAAGVPAEGPLLPWLVRVADWMRWWGYDALDAGGRPWSAVAPSPALRRVAGRVRRGMARPWGEQVVAAVRTWRRLSFVARLRWVALLAGCRLSVSVADDVIVERGVRLELRPGRASLEIGPRCALRHGVFLRLGGSLTLARNVELRPDVVVNVKGSLRFEGRNVLGRGTMLHADDTMVWEWGASCSEYVSVLDSQHAFGGASMHVHDQPVSAAPVRIGAFTLLGAQVVVLPGVQIGRACLVGAASVVTRDLPDRTIAVGSPAKPVRSL